MSIAIVYGSKGGSAASVAKLIKDKLGRDADLINIGEVNVNKLNSYDKLILGSATLGSGELQDDWSEFDKDALELKGKTVALFGTGNQKRHGDTFCDALGLLHDISVKKGAKIVGDKNPTDGYSFNKSKAVVDGSFVGLVVDKDIHGEILEEHVGEWVSLIKANF
jgi:flavodoxin I